MQAYNHARLFATVVAASLTRVYLLSCNDNTARNGAAPTVETKATSL
jgi:hypothetical protein